MSQANWHGKPYYSLDAWCKNTLKRKCYKVALNAHMTCPNRDGTLGSRGCIFCSAGGSGDFAVSFQQSCPTTGDSTRLQLREGIQLISSKLRKKPFPSDSALPCIIAYFQSYTNTYAPVGYLEKIYTSALEAPEVCGISIATRPDCLPDETIALLISLQEKYPDKFIWIELGLQTIHPMTAAYIRRGYPLSCFETAVRKLTMAKLPIIVHVILGLPGETNQDMLETISYLNQFSLFGMKLQLLHVLKGTDLARDYEAGSFETLSMESYLDILIQCMEHLSPETVIHRVTGDGPKELLISPLWSADKRNVLNTLHARMRERGVCQGDKYTAP